jgi:soluble lytic murein transglycosylase-like protein
MSSDYSWTAPRDFRVICACQRHRGRRRTAHLARMAMHHVANYAHRRALALIVGLPLAFGAVGIPMEAMNLSIPALAERARNDFRIFTTPKIRQSVLHPEKTPQTFTFENAKESFFRSQVPYGSIILAEARKNNLQPELVAAVVQAESDFRPRLVSNKSAQGLMQIVPETAGILGCDDPFNPAKNIAAGTRYLRYLINRFGDERIALAAYNAGEGRVERFGGIPPIAETREYLQRVAQHTRTYRERVRNRYVAAMRMGVTTVTD